MLFLIGKNVFLNTVQKTHLMLVPCINDHICLKAIAVPILFLVGILLGFPAPSHQFGAHLNNTLEALYIFILRQCLACLPCRQAGFATWKIVQSASCYLAVIVSPDSSEFCSGNESPEHFPSLI